MGNLHSSAEKLEHEIARFKQLEKQFEHFSDQLTELSKNAEHDPAAREQLESFHQALDSGLTQNLKKLQESAAKMTQSGISPQDTFLDPNFQQALVAQLGGAIEFLPSNKALPSSESAQAPKIKSKSRPFI